MVVESVITFSFMKFKKEKHAKMKAYQVIIFQGLKLEYFSIHSYIVIPSVLLLSHHLALFDQYIAMSHSTEM